ncbi:MAG: M20/M25/M40 family metallo-hydrolase [Parcubacteria group bacterium]|nr:M20/M25/M40 family metallo-hydrolase [Parcubacteria group bacterium]
MPKTKRGQFQLTFCMLLLAFFAFLPGLINAREPNGITKQQIIQTQETITETKLLNTLKILANPNLNGRGTSDGGYDCPSKFIEREFKRYGLKPLGDAIDTKDLLAFGATRSCLETCNGESFITGKDIISRNVIGYIEGETNEWIILGAHYDHLGGDFPGTHIYYGADDNGSGTTITLAIAEALSEMARQQKPKRNILFALWGAEEHGLVGSEYFVKHLPPEIQLNNIVTVVNLDMVGRNEDGKLFCVVMPKQLNYEKVCPDIYALTQSLAKTYGFQLTYTHDGFNASDQASFFDASPPNKRIPIIFYFAGFHPDYHEMTDTYDKINYPKMVRIARMTLTAIWTLSETPKRPIYTDQSITEEKHDPKHWNGCNKER